MKKPKAQASIKFNGPIGEVIQVAFDMGTAFALYEIAKLSQETKEQKEVLELAHIEMCNRIDKLVVVVKKSFPEYFGADVKVQILEEGEINEVPAKRRPRSSSKGSRTGSRSNIDRRSSKETRRTNTKNRKQSKR